MFDLVPTSHVSSMPKRQVLLLLQVLSNYAVDTTRLGVGGFSDGASYALSLGLTNGDLFTHVIAFSPGALYPKESRFGNTGSSL